MKKYRYDIVNLDCAHCAKEVEEELSKQPNLKNVVVNFSSSKISFESAEEISLKELNEIVKKVEPEAEIIDKNSVKQTKEHHISLLVLGVLLGIIGAFVKLPLKLNLIFIVFSYIMLLYKHFINAIKVIFRKHEINENALIVISCVGAFAIGETFEGIMVVALYTLGKILEEKAINKTRKSVKDLIDIKQHYANKQVNEEIEQIDVHEIQVGDLLVVKKGERIPVDGIVIEGDTKLDTSALTGESELAEVHANSSVISGTINVGDVIVIKATELFENSTVSRILTLIEEATDKKAKTETMVSKLSKIYTPTVLLLAVLITFILPLVSTLTFTDSLYRGLTFLVISCPCAIAISVPLSYFVGIGASSKNNILIKGSNYLDNLSHLKKIIFDKTGTLTTGAFKVTNVEVFDENYTKDQIIDIVAKGESLSNHPIAKSIVKLREDIENADVESYTEISGKGIAYELDDKQINVGTIKLCDNCALEADVHINIDGKHVASITIDDGIKKHAKETIEKLHKMGIKTYMFTGDKKEVALEIGKELGIDEIKYEMLPTDKFSEYELVAKDDERVAFVGDGINDAPVLKRAFIGISMGEIGSAAAIEASDIVIMKDDLIKLTEAIEISKDTNKIIKQNLIFAIAVKVIILLLSVFGVVSMWMAVFADTGVTVLTILNTLRLKTKKYN